MRSSGQIPLMAVLVGKEDPLGRDRRAEADRGKVTLPPKTSPV